MATEGTHSPEEDDRTLERGSKVEGRVCVPLTAGSLSEVANNAPPFSLPL